MERIFSQEQDELQFQFTAYLHTALRRQRAKYLRREFCKMENEIACADIGDIEDPTEFVPDDSLHGFCSGLSDRDRCIVMMHTLAGITLKAIAGMMRLSEVATQKAYQRALGKIRMNVEVDMLGF